MGRTYRTLVLGALCVLPLVSAYPARADRSVTLAQSDATVSHSDVTNWDTFTVAGLVNYETGDTLIAAYMYLDGSDMGGSYGFVGSGSPKSYSVVFQRPHQAGPFTMQARVDSRSAGMPGMFFQKFSPVRNVNHP
jgi:hypothetical protein